MTSRPTNITLKQFNNHEIAAWETVNEKCSHYPSQPVSICCCSLCGAAVPVVSTEITTSPQRQMKGKHTEITKGGKPPCPTLWSSLIPSSTWLLHRTWKQRMIDRRRRTHRTHTHKSKSDSSKSEAAHSWPWEQHVWLNNLHLFSFCFLIKFLWHANQLWKYFFFLQLSEDLLSES